MSNNTTVSSATAPSAAVSDTETWVINSVFYLLGGSTALITNFIVFFTTVCDKNLRASSFFLEMSIISLNRCTVAAQCVIIGLYRLLKLINLAPAVLDRSSCYWIFFALVHFSTLDLAYLAFVAVDRIVAIGLPLFYKKLSPKVVSLVFVVIFAITVLGNHVPEFFESAGRPSRIVCVNVVAAKSPNVYYYGTVVTLALSFFIALAYAILVAYILIKYRRGSSISSTEDGRLRFEATMKKHMDILRPLLVLVVSTAICQIIPRCLFFFASASARVIAYAGALSSVDFNVMCWALLTRSSEFRNAFKHRFFKTAAIQIYPTGHRNSLFVKRSSAY